MKLFKCQVCSQTLFFENWTCENCKTGTGYLPAARQLVSIIPKDNYYTAARGRHIKLRACANANQRACNWLIEDDSAETFCRACRHNRVIPDLMQGLNLLHWQKMEAAKHRLFYTLISLRLPLENRIDNPTHGLTFDFLAEAPGGGKILTGHDEGQITINLNEANDGLRETLRTQMGEPYRTLLGHFRHEVGHYFWDVLVRDAGRLDECRTVFGDDTQDYGEALKRHYATGAPADWSNSYISAYATAHPWEDFAETWAHYLHIVDTLETASSFGLRIHPTTTKNKALHADIDFDPHDTVNVETLVNAWAPLTFAVNSLNRSMGHHDLYPFIISPPVVTKLAFIHEIVRAGAVSATRSQTRRPNFMSRMMTNSPEPNPAPPPAPPGPPMPPPVPPGEPEPPPPIELPPGETPQPVRM
jgi:hypothetical protein